MEDDLFQSSPHYLEVAQRDGVYCHSSHREGVKIECGKMLECNAHKTK